MDRRDIVILGMGPSRVYTDWSHKEIWAVNNGYQQAVEMKGHIEKLFLAHGQEWHRYVIDTVNTSEGVARVERKLDEPFPVFNWDEINTLTEAGIEVINTHRIKGLKSRLYPLKRIMNKFDTDFFSDTICYMIAYALDEATTGDRSKGIPVKLKYPLKLWFYGVDMIERSEYIEERGGVEYWLGIANGLGCDKPFITFDSSILKNQRGSPYGMKMNMKNIDPSNLLKTRKRK